jgi:acyl-CoA thioester hydrolase
MPRVFIKTLTVSNDAIDMNGHVNNLVYLSWMQDLAIQHSDAQGWSIGRYLKIGGSWVVRSHFIKYLHPGLLGDVISILTWVSGASKRSSTRKYLFWRERDQKIMAEAETHWVFVDLKTGRPCLIPSELRSAFEIVSEDSEKLLQTIYLSGDRISNSGEQVE